MNVTIWYKDSQGKVVDYVRKANLPDADYFLTRELRGRVVWSRNEKTSVHFFGLHNELLGFAVDTRQT